MREPKPSLTVGLLPRPLTHVSRIQIDSVRFADAVEWMLFLLQS